MNSCSPRSYLLAAVLFSTALAPVAAQDDRDAAFQPIAAAAKAKADAEDYDGALLVLDKSAKTMRGYAPYHFLMGLYSLRYGVQAAGGRSSAGQVESLFADACSQLKKAVELDAKLIEARLRLAEAYQRTGDSENAAKTASALLSDLGPKSGLSDADLLVLHRVRAQAGAKAYSVAKAAKKDAPESLAACRESFAFLEKADALDAALRNTWAATEQWAGKPELAVAVQARAVNESPKDQVALGAMVETARQTGKSDLALVELKKRGDPLTMWYRGKAHLNHAYETPVVQDRDRQFKELESARESFVSCGNGNSAYRQNCDKQEAIVLGCQGFNRFVAKDMRLAEDLFLAAAAKAPDEVRTSILEGRSVIDGIKLVVDHHFSARKATQTIQTLERACAQIPNDADLSNNLGLIARDYATALEARGKKAEARKLFEKSYRAYQNTVRLEPDSVRQRNDLVVVGLYHLGRDLPKVPKILAACIADGEAQLRDKPPADKAELQRLQEAVGDSYQNLGYYLMHVAKDKAAARKNLEKSLTFYPFRSRRSSALLRELGPGKDGEARK